MAAGVYQASDVAPTELIEIGDVVKYIKQELIAKVRQFFSDSGKSYKPNKALGKDAYNVNTASDAEAHRYWDEASPLIQEMIGDGKQGNLIRASEIVNALQQIVQQLTRFRIFSSKGKIKYYKYGYCSKGDCYRSDGPYYKDDTSITATSGFTFLPAKSEAYTGNIQKSVGGVVKTNAVKNVKSSIDTNPATYGVSAGYVLSAKNFKDYITALYNEWQYFVSNHAIEYYSETCYCGSCQLCVTHCYKSCDGRSRR